MMLNTQWEITTVAAVVYIKSVKLMSCLINYTVDRLFFFCMRDMAKTTILHPKDVYCAMLDGVASRNKKITAENIYRIFCNKRPLPINRPPPPLFSTFAKFIFRGFTSLSTANTFAIPGFRKMVHFSTSQANIAYEK